MAAIREDFKTWGGFISIWGFQLGIDNPIQNLIKLPPSPSQLQTNNLAEVDA